MTEQLITSDLIVSGVSGTVIGFGIGYAIKKVMKVVLKLIMVIAVFWVGSLIYLQSIKVINLNERALDNLLNNTFNGVNNLIGYTSATCTDHSLNEIIDSSGKVLNQECINEISQPVVSNLFASFGIPLTTGLGFGILLGWLRG